MDERTKARIEFDRAEAVVRYGAPRFLTMRTPTQPCFLHASEVSAQTFARIDAAMGHLVYIEHWPEGWVTVVDISAALARQGVTAERIEVHPTITAERIHVEDPSVWRQGWPGARPGPYEDEVEPAPDTSWVRENDHG